jgi:hypothetical protein
MLHVNCFFSYKEMRRVYARGTYSATNGDILDSVPTQACILKFKISCEHHLTYIVKIFHGSGSQKLNKGHQVQYTG